MKLSNLILIVVLFGTTGVGDVMAHGGHGHRHGSGVRFGFAIGPFWGPWYSPYYPPIVVQQAPPPVYIEQSSEAAPANYWYYCQASQGYYPYVKACPGGWLKVAPKPEDQP